MHYTAIRQLLPQGVHFPSASLTPGGAHFPPNASSTAERACVCVCVCVCACVCVCSVCVCVCVRARVRVNILRLDISKHNTLYSSGRYYDLELPISLKKGYFFEASQVQGHEHANVSKVLPHLLQGLTHISPKTDLPMDLAIAGRLHQMISAG